MTTSRTPYGFMLFVRLIVRMTIALLVSIPIIALGAILLVYSQTDGTVPAWSGIAAIVTGVVLLILGFYMTAVGSFPYPNLGDGEDVKIERHPTMKPAYARIMISIPLFIVTAVLYAGSELAYIFPFISFMFGLWFFFKGVMRYFRNLHITYIVTDRRAIYMYKFLYLHTNEIPVGRIVQISEKRTLIEALSGRGTVVVSSGIGSRMTINMEEIDNPGAVAEALRSMLPSTQNN
ncbi:MAG: hypothetical protein CL892_05615 [Dehalococcoidia bacterium]|nr:hypothetical protein [Dehalococcoidia bacterium]